MGFWDTSDHYVDTSKNRYYGLWNRITLNSNNIYWDVEGDRYSVIGNVGDSYDINSIYPEANAKIVIQNLSGTVVGAVYPSQIASGGYQYETTITFNKNGGSNTGSCPTTLKPLFGLDSYCAWEGLAHIARTGYTLTGWYSSASGGTKVYDASGYRVAGNAYWNASGKWCWAGNGGLTLYAQWSANSYKLTVNPNGGTWNGSGSSQSFTQKYGATKYIPSPTRANYTFGGWTKSGSGTLSGTTFTYGAGNCTLTAKWNPYKHTVAYNANGGSGAPGSQTKTYGTTLKLSTTQPTRTGYTFKGWGTSSSDTSVDYAAGANYTRDQNGGTYTLYAIWAINSYTFDLNGNLDGVNSGNISGYGTADVYVGGVIKGNDISDYCTAHTYGSKYEIKDIKATTGHWYNGVHSGALSGTIGAGNIKVFLNFTTNKVQIAYHPNGGIVGASGFGYNDYGWITKDGETYFHKINHGVTSKPWNASSFGLTRTGYTFGGWILSNASGSDVLNQDTDYASTRYYHNTDSSKTTANTKLVSCYLYAKWVPVTYENKIEHWTFGYKNGEGTNGDAKTAFRIGLTTFKQSYGSKFNLTINNAVTIPNGYRLEPIFSTGSISGTWTGYPFGTSVTQIAGTMSFEYDYLPIDYNITYNLNGGTNHSSNPSTYNVLYGVTLQNPTREKYTFNGWYIGETKVTGINEGKNAAFTSPDDLYNQLASRTTGDITLTARWNLPEFYFLNMSFISCIRESATTARIKVITSFYEDVDISIINKYPSLSSSTFQNATIESVTLLNGDDTTKTYTHEIVVSIVDSTDFGTFTFSLNDNFTTCKKTVRVSGSNPGDDDICIYDTNACEATDFIEGDYFYGFQKGGRVHAVSFIEEPNTSLLKSDETMIFANCTEK